MKTENLKLKVATVITVILALWEFIAPTAEIVLGIGTKGMSIISLIITILSWFYNSYISKESVFKTVRNKFSNQKK